MSVLSRGVKLKFVQFLRELFRRPEARNGRDRKPAPKRSTPTPAPAPAPRPEPAATAARTVRNGGSTTPQNGNGIHIPLRTIISGLPLELRAKVKQTEFGDLSVPVSIEQILPQLARGAVKISFGEIRQAAPHVFAPGSDSDGVAVILPLGEVLGRLNPSLLIRRTSQKQVEVPADISSPFSEGGKGLVLSPVTPKPLTPPVTRPVTPVPPTPPVRRSITSVPTPPPASAPAPTLAPVAAIRPLSPLPAPSAPSRPMSPAVQAPITPISPIAPITPLAPAASVAPSPVAQPVAQFTASPVAPVSQPTPVASPNPAGEPSSASLPVALAALAEGWPEALRHEIVQLSLAEARVALPVELVETALKRGRVAFPWKVLRSWIRPAPLPTVSVHDSTELELPLKVIAPLFLARQKESAKHQQKVDVDEAIPNLFFGFPRPEAPSAAPSSAASTAKPADTNYYVWDDTAETAHVDETEFKRKQPTGTEFVTRYATPNEIVSRAAALDGVAGALIALPDGLMVASRIPPELNGDTLAAFLPQIFAKVSQCTKELRMGELNNLNFTVGNVPWKIFRVNAIFFAAFGRAGEPLPTAQLAALAAELDRKKSN